MKINHKKGMTLFEILVATLVFTLALGVLLSSLTGILYLIAQAKDETIAVSDLKNVAERIRATPFNSVVTFFPNGVQDGPSFNLYQALVGGYNLTNEHITVTYPNVNADPLEIRITATWQGKYGRSFSTALSTFKTR
jgi:type II secretory pathway pseudopilin PulG